jgi:carboxylesterase type B
MLAFHVRRGFAFGSASLPTYDGVRICAVCFRIISHRPQTSLAMNQSVVVVTVNYRTNIFGFPSSSDPNEISVQGHNLGLLDQDLAQQWTQKNIAAFGGDPQRIAIMGQSAGASSVSYMLNRYNSSAPFQSAILLSSGWLTDRSSELDSNTWNSLAASIGCTGSSGQSRLNCMKGVPAANISAFGNGPTGPPKVFVFIDKWVMH